MSDFPSTIHAPRAIENRPGVVYDEANTKTLYAEDLNNLNNEVVAIENTLGTNPQGVYSTIKAWLTALTAGLAAKQDALGFTAESVANKDVDAALAANSDVKYPSQKAVKAYVDGKKIDSAWPAFAAYDTSTNADKTITNGTLPLSSEIFDQGNNYNTSNYTFTAPVTGIYHFSWTSYTNNNITGAGGGRVCILTDGGNALGDGSGKALSLTVKLTAGQTAKVTTGGNFSASYYAATGHNQFSGHLVKQTA